MSAQLLDHEGGVERVGRVEVQRGPLVIAEPVMLLVVVVVIDHGGLSGEALDERACQRRLSAAGAAGNTDGE